VKLVVTSSAADDLARLRKFQIDKNPSAARRAVAVIADAIDSLAIFPDRGKPSEVDGLRELIVPFGRSAYVVRFTHDPHRQEIVVLRIWHGRETRE
jgi:plasmid stabilization system protein ParE